MIIGISTAALSVQLMPPAEAGLVSREPVKNARSLLRNALPINDRYIREIQVRACGMSSVAWRCSALVARLVCWQTTSWTSGGHQLDAMTAHLSR